MAVESPNLLPSFPNVSWTEPKTDWQSTDKFNKEDYNRIKNNLTYLQKVYHELNNNYSIVDMGGNITTYTAQFKVGRFNQFENVLEALNIYSLKIGDKKTFVSNGVFIDFNELNRIESACVRLYELLCNQYAGRVTLPKVLGMSLQDNFFNL